MSSTTLEKIPVDEYIAVPTSAVDSKNDKFTIGADGLPTVGSMLAKEVKREKLMLWKNILVMAVSWTFLYIAQSTTAMLQSTLNSENGLGVASQAMTHISLIVSSMFIPTWMIKKLGLKWTMVISQLCHSAYVAAQFYPTFYTLIPTAILLGLAAAPMWSANATYITRSGVRYASLVGEEDTEPSISKFFGTFAMGVTTSLIWGSMINSAVLSNEVPLNQTETILNQSISNMNCGGNFCFSEYRAENISDENNIFKANKPPTESIYLLFGILLGFSVSAAIVLALFLDHPKKAEKNPATPEITGWKLLIATFRHLRNPYQILIIPMTFFSGYAFAFIMADFTAAFLVCTFGIESIGSMMVYYGVVSSIFALGFGILVKWIGRQPIFLFACSLSLALSITSLIWIPDSSQPDILYLITCLWALTFSVWQTQLNSIYGTLFTDNKEPAFANFRLWNSLGFAFAFATTTALCVSTRLYIMIGIIVCGTAGYIVIEIMEWKKSKSK